MPANIYIDQNRKVHVASSLPMWHELVPQEAKPLSVLDMTAKAGISDLRYVVETCEAHGFKNDNAVLICEKHSGAILQMAGIGYNCAPVSSLIERAHEIQNALHLSPESCVTAGVLGGNIPGTVWMQLATGTTTIHGLDIARFITVSNSWNGTSKYTVMSGHTAIVCQNTFNMAQAFDTRASVKNTKNRDINLDNQIAANMPDLASTIADYRAQDSATLATLQMWGEKKITRADVDAFLEFIAPNRARKVAELSPATREMRDQLEHALIASPGIRDVPPMTALWLWMAFTWWVSWMQKTRDGQARPTNDLFGVGQDSRDKMRVWLNALP